MAEAIRLRRQVPTRSAAQIAEIIARPTASASPSGHCASPLSFWGEPGGAERRSRKAFGRYEASRRNESGSATSSSAVRAPPAPPGSKRAKLFVLVDDYPGCSWLPGG